MTNARSFTCPECGGQVEAKARTCKYCASPLATVRCAHCFEMNVLDALHCSGCGRELGLEPIGEASAAECPRCDLLLTTFAAGAGTLHDCDACGGQFVEHGLLQDLLEHRALYGAAVPRRRPPENPFSQPLRYLKCPGCKQLMNRKNFGTSSGVIVDVCQVHGVWFDAGELPKVMAFVEAGGLTRARQRLVEELRVAQSRRVESSTTDGGFDSTTITGETGLLDDLSEAGLSLLGLVKDALSRR